MNQDDPKPARKRKSTTEKTTAKKTSRKYTKRTPKKPVEKNYDFGGVWSSIGNGLSTTYDAFNSEGVPCPSELAGAFRGVVYAVSTHIANSLSKIPIKLVSETRKGERPPVGGQKLWRKPKHRSKAADYHEITDNPAIDLLYNPNPSMSWPDLIRATSIDMDNVGRAFWLITTDDNSSLPVRLDVLPARLVTTERDDAGVITGYQLGIRKNVTLQPPERSFSGSGGIVPVAT